MFETDSKLTVEILEDGTIKTTVIGSIDAANHDSAESFLRDVAKLAGGPTTREARDGAEAHHHHHEDGTHHSH